MYKIMEEIDVLERASSTYEKRLSDVLREVRLISDSIRVYLCIFRENEQNSLALAVV